MSTFPRNPVTLLRRVLSPLVPLLPLTLAAGCTLGPGTVTRDRFEYGQAVAESWKSQMLMNLVRIRYGDSAMFLDVGQIVSGYTLDTKFSASGNLFSFDSRVVPTGATSSIGLGAEGQFTDRPTITYSPLMGERFARSMMAPVPPAALLSLIQSGNPADLAFRLMVNTVNGLDNRQGGDLRARPADPEFYAFLERFRRVQLSGTLGVRLRRVDREEATLLTFQKRIEPSVVADSLAIRQLLGLDPESQEFRVVYGAVGANNREIGILTRSVMEILVHLSSFIAVPEAHVTDHRVGPSLPVEEGPTGPIPPLIRVSSSRERPADAFVAVPYRDHWFWIDDRDMPSKRMFSFLMLVFTLVEPGSKEAPPLLTIPAG